jgi:CHAT domain-containing protein
MRLANLLRYLGLGISTGLLTICLTGISPAPALQTPVSTPNVAPVVLPGSSPQQLLEEGKSRYQQGQFADAITLWQKAAEGFAAVGDRGNQAMVLSNLALAYQQVGKMSAAQTSIAQSLQILGCPESGLDCPTTGKEQSRIVAQALTTLGSLQLSQGKVEQAFATWQQAGDRYRQVNDPVGVLRTQINQVQALRAGGLYRRAQSLAQQMNQTLARESNAALKIPGLISYGEVLRLMGQLEQSQQVLEQALKLAQQENNPTAIAATYLGLGNTARAHLRIDSRINRQPVQTALQYYQQAAAIAPDPTTKVQAQLNQLSLLVETQSWQEAENLAAKIPPQLSTLPPGRTRIYTQINYARSAVKLAIRDRDLGYGGQCQAMAAGSSLAPTARMLADAVQQSSDFQDWQAQSFALGYLGHIYEMSGQCAEALPLTRRALALAQGYKALDIAYRWQWQLGRLYRDLARSEVGDPSNPNQANNPNYQNAIAAYQAAFTTLQSLRRDLAAGNLDTQFNFQEQTENPIYQEFVDLLLRPQTPSQENLLRARQVIESLQVAELENFLQEPCVASNPASIDRVVEEANSATAALFPIVLKDRVEVLLKLPGQKNLVHYRYPISEAQVRKTVEQFHRELQQDWSYATVKQPAKAVYDWLLAPARDQLRIAKINTLVFVPDSKLRSIPMAALYDGNQYLVENFATTISLNLELQNPRPLPKQLNVLAASLTDPPANYGNFAKLANVNQELKAIAQAGITVIPIQDKQFTTQAFNQKINESSFSIVHLATHGQFSSDPQKTFLLTASGSIKVDDLGSLFRTRGLNRSDEIELLVLCACETATGDNRAALGIAGTTIRAGARSAIASLWSLDDESNVELMKLFYRQLGKGNISRAEALRQAQEALMKNEQYSYPRYWAPFILLGNWL